MESKDSNQPAAAAGEKKKQLVRVDQELIDHICWRRNPCYMEGYDKILRLMDGFLDAEELEETRALFGSGAAAYDRETDIIKQYKEKGYAVVEVDGYDD